jgi:hypothetical protein
VQGYSPPLYDPTSHVTPPYVTAKPEITVRSLEKDKEVKGQLKFIVAATDGCESLYRVYFGSI